MTAVALGLEEVCAMEVPDLRIIILALQLGAAHIALIMCRDGVVSRATLVLFSSIKVVNFCLQRSLFSCVLYLTDLISLCIALIALLSQISVLVLFFVEILGSKTLISL